MYYKGFLLVESAGGVLRAYRSPLYLEGGVSSYEVLSMNWQDINAMIDEAGDRGEFTEEQYAELTSKIPKEQDVQPASSLHMPDGGVGEVSYRVTSKGDRLFDSVLPTYMITEAHRYLEAGVEEPWASIMEIESNTGSVVNLEEAEETGLVRTKGDMVTVTNLGVAAAEYIALLRKAQQLMKARDIVDVWNQRVGYDPEYTINAVDAEEDLSELVGAGLLERVQI